MENVRRRYVAFQKGIALSAPGTGHIPVLPMTLLTEACFDITRKRLFQLTALLVLPVPVNHAYKVTGVGLPGNEDSTILMKLLELILLGQLLARMQLLTGMLSIIVRIWVTCCLNLPCLRE